MLCTASVYSTGKVRFTNDG